MVVNHIANDMFYWGMHMYHWKTIFVLLLGFIVLGTTISFSAFENYMDQILSKAPSGWAILEKRINAVPMGFHNKDIKGELYIICGPKKVSWNWKDKIGNWHREDLAHESLEIWIFPWDYSPGASTYFNIKGPVLPEKVYESHKAKVYAKPSHRLIIPEEQFNNMVSKATQMYWDDSDGNYSLSWPDWKNGIRIVFESIN
jgi:hypothetical protein